MLFFAEPEEWAILRCDVVRYTLPAGSRRAKPGRPDRPKRGRWAAHAARENMCRRIIVFVCPLVALSPHPCSQRATTCACARATERSIVRFTLRKNQTVCGIFRRAAERSNGRLTLRNKKTECGTLFFFMCALRHRSIDPSVELPSKTECGIFFNSSCVVYCLVELRGAAWR